MALIGGGAAVAFAGVGLLGWASGRMALASLHPASIPMAPSMALGILFLGVAIVLESRRRALRLSRAVACAVSAFAAAQVVIWVAGLPPAVDAFFVPAPGSFEGVVVGRSSALTALGLLLASTSLLLVGLPRTRLLPSVAAILALGVLLLGTIVTLGYLFGAPLLYGSTVLPVAFTTGLALTSEGVGLLGLASPQCAVLRPFVGPSANARLLRAFLPVAPVVVLGELLFAQIHGLNPALTAALTALLSALVAALAVSWSARGLSRLLERAEADRARAYRDAERLAAVVESSDDAIVSKTLDGVITSWNVGAESIFGYPAPEAIGQRMLMLFPADRIHEESQILERIARGERVRDLETVWVRRDGTPIDLSVSISPLEDRGGQIVGASVIARDITASKIREREVARLSRLYVALSQVNQAVVRSPTRDDLLQGICRVLVNAGFRLAWVGWHSPVDDRLVPVAQCGDQDDYLGSITISTREDRPEGRGPSGTAFRERRPFVTNDLLADPASLPWRAALARRGLRASTAVPIREEGEVRGVLNVYAGEVGFFQDKEVALLSEVADDLSFALDNLRREKDRQRAEAAAHSEKLLSDTMIESMPGIVYLYDEGGRFLRWNRNFEEVSGYAGEEIARMSPLAFFAGEDKARLQERIDEVFKKGRSAIEAPFLARDGSLTLYYFTGNRVVLEDRPCLVGVGIDVSERQRAEDARRASEALYHALFEHAPDGLVIADAQSRYLDANVSMCRMLGYPRDEIIGLHASDIVVAAEVSEIEPALEEIKAETAHHREWTFRRKDGTVFLAEVIAAMMPDGKVLGMIRDITERRQAENRLAQSERNYRELVEYANSIILRWTPAGRINFLNEFGQRFFGYSTEEVVGRHVTGTIAPATESSGRDLVRLVEGICATPEAYEQNTNENMRRNGERVWVAWTNRVVRDANGRVIELLSVGTDITERRRAETALRDLADTLESKVATRTEELRAALLRAEEADRLKSAFLATMSHELRTPLNSIIGFTGVVLQGLAGPLSAEQTKQLGMVRISARHLLELINDVLDLSKIEAGQLEVRSEPIDLPALIERVMASVQPQADKKGLELVLDAPPAFGAVVSDRRRVEQILLNLLNNAIKFTDAGRVTLTVDEVAGGGPGGPAVRLRVADTGMGIKEADLATLFQPFRQIDVGLSRQHEGTGLGLAICRRLASLLGGEITARSEWSKGSVFTLTLPLEQGAES